MAPYAAGEASMKSVAWSHGVFTLETLGGMLGPSLFVLPDGRQIAPFHIAPWFDEPEAGSLPGILRRLRGEWPCMPFGAAPGRIDLPGWEQPDPSVEPDAEPHGYASNHLWHWLEGGGGELAMAIDYPQEHPVSRLTRRVRGIDGSPALEFHLCVEVRRACDLPMGLHPVFRLNPQPHSMKLDVDARAAATFPGNVDPSSIFEPNHILSNWRSVPLRGGGNIDPSCLPLAQKTEDLLQCVGTDGRATLTNGPEGYRVSLQWEKDHFPDLLLWFSNHGRSQYPWNGRHLALGVEPVCAALDLGTQVSAASNPIRRAGSATSRRLIPGQPFETRYRVSVETVDWPRSSTSFESP